MLTDAQGRLSALAGCYTIDRELGAPQVVWVDHWFRDLETRGTR